MITLRFSSLPIAFLSLLVSIILTAPAKGVTSEDSQRQTQQESLTALEKLPEHFDIRIKLTSSPTSQLTQEFIDAFNAYYDRVVITSQQAFLTGNGNGGGGGSYVVIDGKKRLADDYFPKIAPSQEAANAADKKNAATSESKTSNATTTAQAEPNPALISALLSGKFTIELDPSNRLTKDERAAVASALNQGVVFSMIASIAGQNVLNPYLPDRRYEGLGRALKYEQLPESVRNKITEARALLERVGIHGPGFWDRVVAGPQVTYRLLSRDEFALIQCPKYQQQIDPGAAKFEDSGQFGCTFQDTTYILQDLFENVSATPQRATEIKTEDDAAIEAARAVIHERLWALKPDAQRLQLTRLTYRLRQLFSAASLPPAKQPKNLNETIAELREAAAYFGFKVNPL